MSNSMRERWKRRRGGKMTRAVRRHRLWRVEYNGENRPVRWTREGDGRTVAMTYDHMGRRREKNNQRFFYDGYLQIANLHSTTTLSTVALAEADQTISNQTIKQFFIWDCTEPIATRPLVWHVCSPDAAEDNSSSLIPNSSFYYTHNGNKNVSEVISSSGDLAAHYDYAPFGVVIAQRGAFAAVNPWRFSSEFADDELDCDYYNYREYEPMTGRWLNRDPIEERTDIKSLASHSLTAFAFARG